MVIDEIRWQQGNNWGNRERQCPVFLGGKRKLRVSGNRFGVRGVVFPLRGGFLGRGKGLPVLRGGKWGSRR